MFTVIWCLLLIIYFNYLLIYSGNWCVQLISCVWARWCVYFKQSSVLRTACLRYVFDLISHECFVHTFSRIIAYILFLFFSCRCGILKRTQCKKIKNQIILSCHNRTLWEIYAVRTFKKLIYKVGKSKISISKVLQTKCFNNAFCVYTDIKKLKVLWWKYVY